jgi:Alpha/beta hydrolase family
MTLLFVHGMGRTKFSAWLLLFRLRRAGFRTATFSYSVMREEFSAIEERLGIQLRALGERGAYALIGHSLGGVLLRAAGRSVVEPPRHLFLLGSPQRPARLAVLLRKNFLFRWLTGDAGQLLGSESRMCRIPKAPWPTTSVIGTGGGRGFLSPFRDEVNDGIVCRTEVAADWLTDVVEVPVLHTFLPQSRKVYEVILARLSGASSVV